MGKLRLPPVHHQVADLTTTPHVQVAAVPVDLVPAAQAQVAAVPVDLVQAVRVQAEAALPRQHLQEGNDQQFNLKGRTGPLFFIYTLKQIVRFNYRSK
jgi:hypothetical protein